MRIQVTENDILTGKVGSDTDCPIAKAIKRRLPDASVVVSDLTVRVDEKEYWLSDKMAKFVYKYDNEQVVRPFSFTLESLEPVADRLVVVK